MHVVVKGSSIYKKLVVMGPRDILKFACVYRITKVLTQVCTKVSETLVYAWWCEKVRV